MRGFGVAERRLKGHTQENSSAVEPVANFLLGNILYLASHVIHGSTVILFQSCCVVILSACSG